VVKHINLTGIVALVSNTALYLVPVLRRTYGCQFPSHARTKTERRATVPLAVGAKIPAAAALPARDRRTAAQPVLVPCPVPVHDGCVPEPEPVPVPVIRATALYSGRFQLGASLRYILPNQGYFFPFCKLETKNYPPTAEMASTILLLLHTTIITTPIVKV
jgi:hypothetical protein